MAQLIALMLIIYSIAYAIATDDYIVFAAAYATYIAGVYGLCIIPLEFPLDPTDLED